MNILFGVLNQNNYYQCKNCTLYKFGNLVTYGPSTILHNQNWGSVRRYISSIVDDLVDDN